MTNLDDLWILICAFMVLEMQAGFLCLEAGQVRSKNAVNVALKNLTDLCLVCLSYWAVGFAFMFGPSWEGVIGTSGFVFEGALEGAGASANYVVFYFQLAFAGTAVTIVSGAVSERAQFKGYLLVSLVASALIYPVFGHWAWGGAFVEGEAGWLAALGFIDFAGSTVVHGIGGWIALAYVIAIGPRIGRFGKHKRRMEPSNLSLAALGALLLWIGWSGFNAGSTLAFNGDVPSILVNTALAAAAGGVAVLLAAILRDKAPNAAHQLNGVLAGLVAVTANCHIVAPYEAVAIGAVGGLVMLASSHALQSLRIDDAVDAAPTHLFAGIWGTLAVALFGDVDSFQSGDRLTQLGVQALGVGAAALWTFPVAWIALKLIGLITPLRVDRAAERDGLNLSEHNESNALHDLTREMRRHQSDGRFSERAKVERATEAGLVAKHYNLVLERAESELMAREQAMALEAKARRAAEKAQKALIEAQREAEWVARHDALTGLANRRFLDELLDSFEDAAAEEPRAFAVICIDLDRFKPINDTYGHAAGDYVLRNVGLLLRSEVRDSDFVARIGGDEFVIVIDGPPLARDVRRICERLLKRLEEPLQYDSVALSIGASFGFALSDEDEIPPRDVLVRADLALYKAKEAGRSCVQDFNPAMAMDAQERRRVEADIRTALRRGEFEPFYQPQFNARTGEISGIEALARWRHPKMGVLTPGDFLDVAEESGLTPAIDAAILDHALAALKKWDAAGLPTPRISVNVSARRLRSDTLLQELRARDDIPRGRLSFEILETVFVDADDADLTWRIDALKELGIEIEIDDFGTGHASISSILALKPHRLKLDRLFVDGVELEEQRRGLLRSLVGVAKSMGLLMVGEGVENARQAEILLEEGCAHLQGFALARPMDRACFDAWLAGGGRPALALGEAARQSA